MQRIELIERLRRQVYGSFPSDESTITDGLVNSWLNEGLALAAKANYKDNLTIDGVGYVNNSFYSTFKGIAITKDEKALYKLSLPEIPIGIGRNEGASLLRFKDEDGNVSLPAIFLSEAQLSFSQTMRPIPNKVLAYPESGFMYMITTLPLNRYTATVTMISGGDSSDLTSTLNVPADYLNVAIEYVKAQVLLERQQPVDAANDGLDAIRTT